MVRPSVPGLLVVLALSAASVGLVAADVLGTVWLVAGPAVAGAAEIIFSHLNGRPGQAVEAAKNVPTPADAR
jgi:hypothetical protein